MDKLAAPGSMRDVFAILNEMKVDGVFEKYAVGGAVASSIHLEPTTTADVDIFIMLKPHPGKKLLTLEPVYEYLVRKGGRLEGQYVVYAGWPLQFLPADSSPLVAEALDNAQEFEAEGVSVWVFRPEYLAAIALDVGRGKDKLRLDSLVKSGILDSREFKGIVQRHRLERKYGDWLEWRKTV